MVRFDISPTKETHSDNDASTTTYSQYGKSFGILIQIEASFPFLLQKYDILQSQDGGSHIKISGKNV